MCGKAASTGDFGSSVSITLDELKLAGDVMDIVGIKLKCEKVAKYY